MPTEHEFGHKTRILKLLFLLIDQPFRYKKKELAERFQVHQTTIERDFEDFRNLGLLPDCDRQYRYGFRQNDPFKQLKDLLHFTEEDQFLLGQAIDKIAPHTKRAEVLKRKLASLYDYHRLGHVYLRKPYLTRMDRLQQAIREKRQVILYGYRSTNSNVVGDRRVEPFHLNPPEDVVQAYDLDKRKLRFFRMSRIEKVGLTEAGWAFEKYHQVMPADPFRIVDNDQVPVHIRLQIGAYNDLVERFPLTLSYLQKSEEDEWFDFACRVNHRFIGLSSFLLGNWESVEILDPEHLREHMRALVGRMRF
ncbi:MAG: WYL domain-containing protein [Lewinella sp.]|nr:WYL domain-containing protein [Lewinella sp.]